MALERILDDIELFWLLLVTSSGIEAVMPGQVRQGQCHLGIRSDHIVFFTKFTGTQTGFNSHLYWIPDDPDSLIGDLCYGNICHVGYRSFSAIEGRRA